MHAAKAGIRPDSNTKVRTMEPIVNLYLRFVVALTGPSVRDGRDERGDVPGWVLITVMTAGLVGALWAFAGQRLEQLLRDALNSVGG
jgi:hypothetical protein